MQGDDHVRTTGFPNEYAQSLMNILCNAKDALKNRNVHDPQIEITIARNETGSVVSIRDNGGGIPEEVMPYIFEPYFSTKSSVTGTGLGLYLARTLIERNMGGRLTARNLEDGAELIIEL